VTATSTLQERVLAQELEAHGLGGAKAAFVLGSGLGALAEALEERVVVPFERLESMPASTVPGHAGRFVRGKLAGVEVLVQQGRLHLYEGHSVRRVVRPVRAFAELGVGCLVLTNAAGGLVPEWRPPVLMRITDHINLQGCSPLRREEAGRGCPYDEELGQLLVASASACGIELVHGVYAGLLGPTYETPAEIRMLARRGAQAVGMSTVAEALAGHASGMRVLGVSCISNAAAGISAGPLSHEEVVEAGKEVAADFVRLLTELTPRLPAGEAS